MNQISGCYKKEGIKLCQAKKWPQAIERFDFAIKKCSSDYDDKYSLFWWKANTLKLNGNISEASISYQSALSMAPNDKKEEIRKQLKGLK